MISFALNKDHDLTIDTLGNIKTVADGDEVAQQVKTRLLFFKGEWFLDLDAGLPYFQEIFVRPASVKIIEARLKNEILTTPGIEKINSFAIVTNETTRTATVSFTVTSTYGTLSANLPLNIA